MENRVKFDISTSTIIKLALAVLAVWFLFAIKDVLVLFFIVLVIVAALAPIVDNLSKYIPRWLSVLLFAVILLGVLSLIGVLLVPLIITELQMLSVNLPIIMSKLGPLYQSIQDSVGNYQEGLFNISSQLARISTNIYSTTIGFISGFIALLTVFVLTFYMLLEKDSIKNFIQQTIPIDSHEKIVIILKKISEKMGGWLRGQVFLMLAVGILDGIALAVLGVPYALVLALWGGLTEVIPFIGPWLGLVPAFLVALTISPVKAIIVLVVFVLIQQLEAQFLAPKIMGKAVGLSPVIIILALLIGAQLMGILGVIFAIPAAAVVSVIIQEWREIKKIRS